MHFCPNCGVKITNKVNFCPNCGQKLNSIVETTVSTTKSENESDNRAVVGEKKVQHKFVSGSHDEPSREQRLLNDQLSRALKTLYSILLSTFDAPRSNGTLEQNFGRIRVRSSDKIKGYDSDELAKRVEPLCRPNYVATSADVQFIQELMKKYKNYFQKSKLENILNMLSGQSSTAIVDDKHLNRVQEYLHVDRGNLEQDFHDVLMQFNNQRGKLAFLVGNVGDGKSHLIGYMKSQYPDIFSLNKINIHYDATESFDPQKTAMDTLMELLQPFSDNYVENNRENWVVAINMGILVNLINRMKASGQFTKLLSFLAETGITEQSSSLHITKNDFFELLSFRSYPVFQIDETGVNSAFYDELFSKVTVQSESNPFYNAYLEDKEKHIVHLTHHNYEFFSNKNTQKALKYLLIKVQVESKVIISTRALLELIHDILIPAKLEEHQVINYEGSLPYLLFAGFGDSPLIKKINEFDPIDFQNDQIERLTTKVYSSQRQLSDLAHDVLDRDDLQNIQWLWSYISEESGDPSGKIDFSEKVGLLIRIKYLVDYQDAAFNDQYYLDYLKLIRDARENGQRAESVRQLYKLIKAFVYQWCGSPKSDFVYTFINEEKKFGIAIPFDMNFTGVTVVGNNVVLSLKNSDVNTSYSLSVDYDLFKLIETVNQGYLLKNKDKRQFVNVANFIENIIKSNRAVKETVIGNIETKEFYRLTDDGFEVEMEAMN
ncbi:MULTISPECIES: DNA phosphorothioation-dependent restriction protein DptF [Lactiplantibacillus]|nr:MULTISPECIES: DNA phosphorothioation-dependent restriction protein DptF [Lactiplantibacillus]MBU7461857.1 DNA phosphorothioation-dependent restriction protein DptF [Lactiplantibacillus pentosus]MBU7478138.1 DNA phosphorothioation-dependent restriction protein DptF [Lactiplantibacillus pentosus]MBU7484460.1 DNA phosphorothioation-dependent restriction protein DptF [Lactiplantibacillus sp. 30.2.29]MBU7487771.1 DNA phosphorothioation-dependent restriction protein DptF [Lactiplantibacillus pento